MLGWMEIAIIMTAFTMIMVWALVIISVVNKRSGVAVPTPTAVAAPSQPQFLKGANLHLFIGVLMVVTLAIIAPLGWVVFGQPGMLWVRLCTTALLLACLYLVITVAIVIATSKTPFNQWQIPNPSLGDHDPSMQVSLVARITQRFCPRCRAPLAADAPEGLCPACLMAGGFASGTVDAPAQGMAVTTPPSGSTPPSTGEWSDLAQHFPQLEILELLGRGGMGAVYKARQKNLDRVVALKVIPPEAARDPTFAERFAREARALARLNHPNIVTVYDFGQTGEIYYLLMEYVDGVNLRHAQQASRLAPSEALAIVPQICDALQYAHDQGVVHRDIKPENVLLDRSGRVKIADFGLAKLLGKGPDNFTLTRTQQVMGTPRYMAPEQIERPTSVDHRADIYSLGVVLYEMLTGELPIGRFQPPSEKVQVDVRIDQVVLRALDKEPERRYQRASQVKTELASLASWPQTAARTSAGGAPARPVWQSPLPAAKYAAPQPARGGAGAWKTALIVGVALPIAICSGILATIVLPYVLLSARSSAQQAQSMNQLKQIGLALHSYHDVYGSFPPAVVTDDDGKPLYSGRVLLLPFLDQENVYRSFDLTQAWDSPRNLAISETPVTVFMDPSDSANQVAGKTNYLFVSGTGTMFEADKTTRLFDITDGLSNTIAIVEAKGNTTKWAQPDDLDFSQPRRLPPGSQLVLFADGSVRDLDSKLTPMQIRALATIDAGDLPWQNVPPPAITPVNPRQTPSTPATLTPPGAPSPPSAPPAPGGFAPPPAPTLPQPEQEP
jgi:tRNA A-37 threonylcarbamoyl transferase component Bud32/type II secretory pathway pseudopilin PulG